MPEGKTGTGLGIYVHLHSLLSLRDYRWPYSKEKQYTESWHNQDNKRGLDI